MRSCSLFSLLILLSFALFASAEEDLVWELDFELKEKSTLANFPMQEIDGDELASAVVEGALQSTSAGSQSAEGKPAYEQEKEGTNKRKVGEVNSTDIIDAEDLEQLNQFALPSTPPDISFDVYQQPNGRTYDFLQTTTVERP